MTYDNKRKVDSVNWRQPDPTASSREQRMSFRKKRDKSTLTKYEEDETRRRKTRLNSNRLGHFIFQDQDGKIEHGEFF